MSAAIVRGDALHLPLRDESVDLIVTSPPYFALRSYQDGGEHYEGQIGSEPTPADFLRALWAVMDECWRVVKPTGSVFVNLGDKYAGSGGHNNAGLSGKAVPPPPGVVVAPNGHGARRQFAGGGGHERRADQRNASRRNAPDRYNQSADVRPKSLMGLPWRFALGCFIPDLYRRPFDGAAGCWHDEQPCTACRPNHPQGIARAEIVWSKPNGLPESVKDRVRRSHEQWFHLTKQGDYFANVDEVREPHAEGAWEKGPRSSYKPGSASGSIGADGTHERKGDAGLPLNPLGKLPGSVWTVPTEPLIVPEHVASDHFAAFPQEWPRRLILGWSPPDGVVLDPFGGTGTTAMVARALGRYGISLDLSADYLRLARWRIFDSGHASKSRERTNREAQGSLLGGAA